MKRKGNVCGLNDGDVRNVLRRVCETVVSAITRVILSLHRSVQPAATSHRWHHHL